MKKWLIAGMLCLIALSSGCTQFPMGMQEDINYVRALPVEFTCNDRSLLLTHILRGDGYTAHYHNGYASWLGGGATVPLLG